jgi:N,N'-diacetylchitobiose transport system permease protein
MSLTQTPTRPVVSSALPARRRRPLRDQLTPYLLATPTLLVLAGLLGYPLVRMVVLSFQQQSLRQMFSGEGASWAGLANYRAVLTNSFFWTVTARTLLICAICVILSVLGGLLVALLMRRVSSWVRICMIVSMMLVWSLPQLVATQVFGWLVDTDWGVLNWVINLVPGVDFTNHSWFVDPTQGWVVIIMLVVWGAVPFIAITLDAGLSQVPRELTEAALVDGASDRQVFRHVTLPIIRPLLIIMITLSTIWDMGMFTQNYVIRASRPEVEYYSLSVYAYQEAFAQHNYSLGAAISILTVLLLAGVMALYVRQMFPIGDAD